MKTVIIRVLDFVMTARTSLYTLSNSYIHFYHCFPISVVVLRTLLDMRMI